MLKRMSVLVTCAAAAALAVAACKGKPTEPEGQGEDPAYAHALAGPLMTDGELASRNKAIAAIAGGGAQVVELPLVEDGPDAIAAAKGEAEKLVGGKIGMVPLASEGSNAVLRNAVTAAQRGAAVEGPGQDCAAKASDGLSWSLGLPQTLPIYPRGHLLEAAGSDKDGCHLRVVRFVTPVEPGAVVDFYYTRTKAAKSAARHLAADEVHVLEGSKGAAVYAIQVRKREDGLTEADIVVNGVL
jgi:hypothetical protein